MPNSEKQFNKVLMWALLAVFIILLLVCIFLFVRYSDEAIAKEPNRTPAKQMVVDKNKQTSSDTNTEEATQEPLSEPNDTASEPTPSTKYEVPTETPEATKWTRGKHKSDGHPFNVLLNEKKQRLLLECANMQGNYTGWNNRPLAVFDAGELLSVSKYEILNKVTRETVELPQVQSDFDTNQNEYVFVTVDDNRVYRFVVPTGARYCD